MLKRYLARHNLPDFNHLSLQFNKWRVAVWDKQDLHEVVNKPSIMFPFIDKIMAEIHNNPKTTIKYDQLTEKYGLPIMKIKPRNIQDEIDNIIPSAGLRVMAQRGTGASSTTNTHMAVGDDPTPEALGDTVLGNEIDRKSIVTYGTRGVPSGTAIEQYGMPWLDTDFTVPETLDEAGLLTAGTGGTLIAHVTFATKTIDAGQIMTTQVNITHQNGTQV